MPTIAGPAPARLHAGIDPPAVRAHRHQQGRRLDRLREPRDRAARRPRPEGAARDGGARPGEAGAHQLGRDLRRRGASRGLPCAGRIRSSPSSARATSRLGRELWIERDDFVETPAKGYFRLFPGNRVRLKYGYVVECTGCEKDAAGTVTRCCATLVPDTKSGTPGADAVKVKGTITWVGRRRCARRRGAAVRPALQPTPQPDAGGKDFKASLNPASKQVVAGLRRAVARRPRAPASASSSSATATSSPTASTTRRPAGVQPHRDAARHLVALAPPRRLTSAARSRCGRR